MSHDQLFKELLQEFLAEFIAAFLPEPAKQIDWSHIELPNTELFTEFPQGDRRALDFIAVVRTVAGDPEWLLIHIEIEADPRPDFPERMYEYYALLRRRRRIPVLPIAVFLSGRHGGITTAAFVESVLGLDVLCFRYHLISIPEISRAQLPARNPMPHALAPLLAGHPADPIQLLVESLEGIAATEGDRARQALLAAFLQSYVPLDDEQQRELRERLAADEHPEVLQMVNPWTEWGRAEGRAEGARRAMARVLRARFGDLPSDLIDALDGITSDEELEDLAAVAATATSLEDFRTQVPAGEAPSDA